MTEFPEPELLATCWTHAGPAAPKAGIETSPLGPARRADVVASAGFTGIGFTQFDIVQAREEMGLSQLRRLLDDHGLVHRELEFLSGWWDGSDAHDRAVLLEASEVLGVRQIKIGPAVDLDARGPLPQLSELESWAEALRELGRQAAAAGTRVALEPQPMSNIAEFPLAGELVAMADHPAVGLAVDIWHVERGPSSLEDIAALDPAAIFCVEIDDALAEPRGSLFADTVDRRVDCGEGAFDLVGFMRTLVSAGFDGPWGVEIISERHRATPVEEAVPRSYEAARRVFRQAGIGAPASG